MRPQTHDYLKSVGVEPWLLGFNPLGDLIDMVTDALVEDEQPAHMYAYYEELGRKYAANPERLERNIRHCISMGWRTKQSGMEDVTRKALVRPPAPRYFVYRSAEYLMGLEE